MHTVRGLGWFPKRYQIYGVKYYQVWQLKPNETKLVQSYLQNYHLDYYYVLENASVTLIHETILHVN